MHHHKTQQLKQNKSHLETYTIEQQADASLNTNKTEPFTLGTQI